MIHVRAYAAWLTVMRNQDKIPASARTGRKRPAFALHANVALPKTKED